MNKKIKKYMDEIQKTEKKIEELQQYLKGLRTALKQEEDSEMIKSIRSMKLDTQALHGLLNGIQDGSVTFRVAESGEEEISSFTKNSKEEQQYDGMDEME